MEFEFERELLPESIKSKLIENFNEQQKAVLNDSCIDFKPIVKFFGGSSCTWLFTEYIPEDECFFGLCDYGMGFPELGYVSKEELFQVRFPPFHLPIERDFHFEAEKTLSQYAEIARAKQRIIA